MLSSREHAVDLSEDHDSKASCIPHIYHEDEYCFLSKWIN